MIPNDFLWKTSRSARMAPPYLSELCWQTRNIEGRCQLHSATRSDLDVPRCWLSTYGRRAFSWTAGPSTMELFTWSFKEQYMYINYRTIKAFIKIFYFFLATSAWSALEIFMIMRYINLHLLYISLRPKGTPWVVSGTKKLRLDTPASLWATLARCGRSSHIQAWGDGVARHRIICLSYVHPLLKLLNDSIFVLPASIYLLFQGFSWTHTAVIPSLLLDQ